MFARKCSGYGYAWRCCWAAPLLVSLSSCFALPPPEAKSSVADESKNQAILEGFVVELDGAYTRSDGQPIELSPGCHIAKTTADALLEDKDGVIVTWKQVPVVYFRVDAVAGYRYRVDRSVELMDGRYNVLMVVLRSYDDKNNLVSQQKIAYGANTDTQRPVCPS